MSLAPEPEDTVDGSDETVEEPAFRVPFSDADRELLLGWAPQYVELLELVGEVREGAGSICSLGPRESLAALRALEVARRLLESLSTDLLAAYRRMGDSAAHGYRTTVALLAGEFRITPREARRRTNLSDQLAGRISESGEALQPVRPAIADNFADGRISADEARALCDAVDALPPTAAQMYADRVEKTLVELAPTVQLKDFPKLCHRIVQHIDEDGSLPAFEPEPHKYNVTLSQQRNGDWRLRGLLSSPTGTTLHALLYGRMKDADVPVTVRPHRDCNAEAPAESAGTERSTRGSSATAPPAGPGTPDSEPSFPESGASASVIGSGSDEATRMGAGAPGSFAPLPDDDEYTASSVPVRDDQIPTIPREAEWESTQVTVHADARVEINGVSWVLDEDEPQFVISQDGWAVLLPDRIFHAVQELLEKARSSDDEVASSVLWEKVLGRRPTASEDGDATGSGESSALQRRGLYESDAAPDSSSPLDSSVPLGWPVRPDLPPQPQPQPPPLPQGEAGVPTGGVFADGSRSGARLDVEEAHSPGAARHDRFAFLIRCASRERVLHGADHALVITARPDDLTKPGNLLTTHKGGPVSLAATEEWSNAAQTFLHLLDGQGRTIQVSSAGRFATRSQMIVLAARDQGCTFPDCDAPAEWCEAHHIVAWARGGETTIDNLTLMCPFHHRWFEKSGWDGKFLKGLPAWVPPRHIDRKQRPLYHSRFRVALMNLPPELPLTAG